MVTVAAFVLDLMALGQIFNITPSPNAFLAWGAFAMMLAYAYRLRWLLAAGLAGLTIWVAATIAVLSGAYWTAAAERPENYLLPAAAIILYGVLRRENDLSGAYRLTGWLFGFIALLFLSTAGESYLSTDPKLMRKIYQIAGLAAAAGAIWLGIRRQWPGTVNIGSVFFTIYLIVRLVDWWWDTLPKYLFFLIVGGIAVLLLIIFRKLRNRMEAR
jgi:uncharacterized membrane protein